MALPFQTSPVAESITEYMIGQIVSARPGDVMTARVPSDGIAPGVVVILDASDTPGTGEPRAFRLPSALADITEAQVWGILALDDTYENDSTGTFVYDTNDLAPVVIRGVVAMESEDAIAAGASPFVRCVATPPELQGALRSDADGTDAAQLTNLRTLDPIDSGTTGRVELR